MTNIQKVTAFVVLVSAVLVATAMPTSDEMKQVNALVNELMSEHVNAYKAHKKSANEVGDAAFDFVKDAKGEAAKFVLLKGAIHFYSLAKNFDKVADALEAMQSQIKDLPPSEVAAIASMALNRAGANAAQRLNAIYYVASTQAKAEKDVRSFKAALRKNPADATAIRGLADAYVRLGDWQKALKEFSKLDVKAATFELNPDDAKDFDLLKAADHWWGVSANDVVPYRVHAAMLYRKAMDAGLVEGLMKSLVEKRIAETEGRGSPPGSGEARSVGSEGREASQPVLDTQEAAEAPFSRAAALKKGLIHRWSFNGNLRDSVAGRDGKAVDGNVTFENGQVRIRPNGGYVNLGGNVLPGGGESEYTIEIWATKHSIQNWARVFQIPDNWGGNDFYWTWNAGKDPRKWGWKVPGFGHWYKTIGDGTGIGIENHFVVVYGHDADKKPCFHVYVLRGEKMYWHRGERLAGKMFKTHFAFLLGHSFSSDKIAVTADASYNEVRIWNRALTQDEVMHSAKLGPDKIP